MDAEIYTLVNRINTFRNDSIAHQNKELADPRLARDARREWSAGVARLRESSREGKIAIAGRARPQREWAHMSQPMTSAEKRDLKARAQRLEPIVKLGHGGMSEAFLKSLDAALTTHGLVKIKFTDFKAERKTLAPEIAEKTGSAQIMQVGNVVVYFRAKPDAPRL